MSPPHNETAPDCNPRRLKVVSDSQNVAFIPAKEPVAQARLNAEREWLRIQRKHIEITRLRRP